MDKEIYNFDALKLFSLLFKSKWWILLFTIIATVISAGIAFKIPVKFKSSVVVVPPKSSESLEGAISSISSTLKEIGLTKLSGGSGESYSMLVVLNSRQLVDSIIKEFDLPKAYDIPEKDMDLVKLEFTDNSEIAYYKEGNYEITIWDTDKYRAANIANRYVVLANRLALDLFRKEAEMSQKNMTLRLNATDSTLKAVGDSLEKFSARTLLYSPTDQSKSISTALSDLKSQEMKFDIMHEYYKTLYGENDFLTISQSKLKDEISDKIVKMTTTSGFMGNFSMQNATGVGIEYLRLYTEFETYAKVKAFLLPMVEKTKLDQIRELKNLIVLDPAQPAYKKDKPKRSLIIAGSCLGSFIFICVLIILIDAFKNMVSRYKENYS